MGDLSDRETLNSVKNHEWVLKLCQGLHILQLIFVIVAVTTSRVSVKEMGEDERI